MAIQALSSACDPTPEPGSTREDRAELNETERRSLDASIERAQDEQAAERRQTRRTQQAAAHHPDASQPANPKPPAPADAHSAHPGSLMLALPRTATKLPLDARVGNSSQLIPYKAGHT
jgi:hypothetical protein